MTQSSGVFVKQVVFLTVSHRGPLPLRELHSTDEEFVWRDPGGSWACLRPAYDDDWISPACGMRHKHVTILWIKSDLRSCVKFGVLGSACLKVHNFMVSVDVKQHWTESSRFSCGQPSQITTPLVEGIIVHSIGEALTVWIEGPWGNLQSAFYDRFPSGSETTMQPAVTWTTGDRRNRSCTGVI